MPVDATATGTLHRMLYRLRPQPDPGRRMARLRDPVSFPAEAMTNAAAELRFPGVGATLDAGELAALVEVAAGGRSEGAEGRLASGVAMLDALLRLLDERWDELGVEVALVALGEPHRGGAILQAIPRLVGSRAMIEAIAIACELGGGCMRSA